MASFYPIPCLALTALRMWKCWLPMCTGKPAVGSNSTPRTHANQRQSTQMVCLLESQLMPAFLQPKGQQVLFSPPITSCPVVRIYLSLGLLPDFRHTKGKSLRLLQTATLGMCKNWDFVGSVPYPVWGCFKEKPKGTKARLGGADKNKSFL